MSSSLNSRIVDRQRMRAHPLAGSSDSGVAAPSPGEEAAASLVPNRRRALLLALVASPLLLCLPRRGVASSDVLAGLQRWGRGEFRRFGFLVYSATLWAGGDPVRPPLALRLDYKRSIPGAAIAEASVREMRRFIDDPVRLDAWGAQMRQVFPDVQPGDHLIGLYRPEGAYFYQGERQLGIIAAPGFAAAFFAIWLDPRTSAPELRAALLNRSAG